MQKSDGSRPQIVDYHELYEMVTLIAAAVLAITLFLEKISTASDGDYRTRNFFPLAQCTENTEGSTPAYLLPDTDIARCTIATMEDITWALCWHSGCRGVCWPTLDNSLATGPAGRKGCFLSGRTELLHCCQLPGVDRNPPGGENLSDANNPLPTLSGRNDLK